MHLQEGKSVEKYCAGETADSVRLTNEQVKQMKSSDNVRRTRAFLRSNIFDEMNKVRSAQTEKDPSNPKINIFAQTFLYDLDDALGNISDIGDDQKYEIRFYSAVDTILDYGGSFDCWVEIYDLQNKKVLKTVKIDITSNPEKQFPGGMADIILYFDPKYLNARSKGKISPDFFQDTDYKNFLRAVSKNILASGVINAAA